MLTTLTILTGLLSVLATSLTLPLTPPLIWAWRFRRHMETVKAIDAERQRNQHEVLMRRADYFASKVAAAYHIPVAWDIYRWASIQIVVLPSFAAVLVLQWIYLPDEPLLKRLAYLFMLVCYVTLQAIVGSVQFSRLRKIKAHRAEFIAQGCPPDFPSTPTEEPAVTNPTASGASHTASAGDVGPPDTPDEDRTTYAAARRQIVRLLSRRTKGDTNIRKQLAKQQLDAAREESRTKFARVWLAQRRFWLIGMQMAFIGATLVLIISAAMLGTTAPQPATSIVMVVTAVLTVGSLVSAGAYLTDVLQDVDPNV